jgi:hypothetical protein
MDGVLKNGHLGRISRRKCCCELKMEKKGVGGVESRECGVVG